MSHKLALEYLLTLSSSKPSSFSNSCLLGCSYSLQSSKKCLTVSGWPHIQSGVKDNPIECKCEFKFDLFNLSWVWRALGNLNPQLKCLNLGGFHYDGTTPNHTNKSMKKLKRPNSLFLEWEVSSVVLKTGKLGKLKCELLKIFKYYTTSGGVPCESWRPDDFRNVVLFGCSTF